VRKLSTLALSFAVALSISSFNPAVAQGRGGHGKPAETGVEHAETVANPEGVQHGIENAESKQGKTDNDSKESTKKLKHKKHHRKEQTEKKG